MANQLALLIDVIPDRVSGLLRLAVQNHPHLMSRHAAGMNVAQGFDTDRCVIKLKVDVLLHSDLERIGRIICIPTIGKQPAFNTLNRIGVARPDAKCLTSFAHKIPKVTATCTIH